MKTHAGAQYNGLADQLASEENLSDWQKRVGIRVLDAAALCADL